MTHLKISRANSVYGFDLFRGTVEINRKNLSSSLEKLTEEFESNVYRMCEKAVPSIQVTCGRCKPEIERDATSVAVHGF